LKFRQKENRVCPTSFASIYPLHVAKAGKKERTQAEVDRVIRWLSGFNLGTS